MESKDGGYCWRRVELVVISKEEEEVRERKKTFFFLKLGIFKISDLYISII